jgi:hypothetical protein
MAQLQVPSKANEPDGHGRPDFRRGFGLGGQIEERIEDNPLSGAPQRRPAGRGVGGRVPCRRDEPSEHRVEGQRVPPGSERQARRSLGLQQRLNDQIREDSRGSPEAEGLPRFRGELLLRTPRSRRRRYEHGEDPFRDVEVLRLD